MPTTGAHLWAEKFDGPMADVFALQDKVASHVAGVIDPLLLDSEIRRASEHPTTDLTAYHFYLRALPHLRAWSREDNLRAIALLEQAVDIRPAIWNGAGLAGTVPFAKRLERMD